MNWADLPRSSGTRIQLPYVEQGDGEPVVLVHGSNSDHRIWNQHREIIAKRHRVITLSQRYFGKDPWTDNGEQFSIAMLADDLAEFISGLGVGPATVVGWSFGAGVSLAMAVRHHALVKRMFLYEPPLATFVTSPEAAKIALDDRLAMMAAAKPLAASGDLTGSVRMFMDAVNDQAGAFDGLTPEVRAMMTENARMLPLLFAGPPPPPITDSLLRQLSIPITIGLGEHSRANYQITARAAASLLPRAQLTVVNGARHLWPIQQPSAFTQGLLDFLDSG